MKRWLCAASGRYEHVAADTEVGARERCVEQHGFSPETANIVPWPDRNTEPQFVEVYPHHYAVLLFAKR